MAKRVRPTSPNAFLEDLIRDWLRPEKLVYQVIVAELNSRGVRLTPQNLAALEAEAARVIATSDPKMHIEFDESANPHLTRSQIEAHCRDTLNGLNGGVERYLKSITKPVMRAVVEATTDTANASAPVIHKSIRRRRKRALALLHAQRDGIAEAIRLHWGLAIDALQMQIQIAIEAEREFVERTVNIRRGRRMREVLERLHVRGCQVANEIALLLSNGYADGAHARWRSLHEIACIAWFIQAEGERTAHRYMLHEAITRKKLAEAQQKAWPAYANSRTFQSDLKKARVEFDALVKKYGRTYATDYGWAIPCFRSKPPSFVPTFRDLEDAVAFDSIRPHYAHANVNVHAGALAMHHRLGLGPVRSSDLLLADQSPYGLGDPGILTARSLHMLTVPLLMSTPSLEGIVAAKALELMADDSARRFLAAAKRAGRDIELVVEMFNADNRRCRR